MLDGERPTDLELKKRCEILCNFLHIIGDDMGLMMSGKCCDWKDRPPVQRPLSLRGGMAATTVRAAMADLFG
jgi:hypothetical protein